MSVFISCFVEPLSLRTSQAGPMDFWTAFLVTKSCLLQNFSLNTCTRSHTDPAAKFLSRGHLQFISDERPQPLLSFLDVGQTDFAMLFCEHFILRGLLICSSQVKSVFSSSEDRTNRDETKENWYTSSQIGYEDYWRCSFPLKASKLRLHTHEIMEETVNVKSLKQVLFWNSTKCPPSLKSS